jgi:tetratricopeptide (TPR) repeat protein
MFNMKKIIQFAALLLALSSCNTTNFHSSDALINAVINENWTGAINLCDNQYKDSSSAIYRAIKGHVYLAGNRNNESLDMFLSLNNSKDKQTWITWCQSKQIEVRKNAVVLYFTGDACARLGNWNDAIEKYSQAKEHDPNNLTKAMILNAMGVSNVNIGQIDEGRKIIEEVNNIAPNFADAYASIGTIYIIQRTAKGASEYFQKALEKSNEFALAHNGKGCALRGMYLLDSLKLGIEQILICTKYQSTKDLSMNNLMAIFNLSDQEKYDFSIDATAGTSLTAFGKQGPLSSWSDDDLKRAIDHNENVNRGLGVIPKVTFKYGGESGSAETEDPFSGIKDHTKANLEAQKAELGRRGITYDSPKAAGGGLTYLLDDALIDDGKWRVTNWFGLVQNN